MPMADWWNMEAIEYIDAIHAAYPNDVVVSLIWQRVQLGERTDEVMNNIVALEALGYVPTPPPPPEPAP
jgi:hypothetical protein